MLKRLWAVLASITRRLESIDEALKRGDDWLRRDGLGLDALPPPPKEVVNEALPGGETAGANGKPARAGNRGR